MNRTELIKENIELLNNVNYLTNQRFNVIKILLKYIHRFRPADKIDVMNYIKEDIKNLQNVLEETNRAKYSEYTKETCDNYININNSQHNNIGYIANSINELDKIYKSLINDINEGNEINVDEIEEKVNKIVNHKPLVNLKNLYIYDDDIEGEEYDEI